MLGDLGHQALWAKNGADAIEKINEESDIDLVLLDWNMPVMDGLEFLIKNQNEGICSCPVMMMTTENSPEKIQEAIENGASDFIMKPFTLDILEYKIDLVC